MKILPFLLLLAIACNITEPVKPNIQLIEWWYVADPDDIKIRYRVEPLAPRYQLSVTIGGGHTFLIHGSTDCESSSMTIIPDVTTTLSVVVGEYTQTVYVYP